MTPARHRGTQAASLPSGSSEDVQFLHADGAEDADFLSAFDGTHQHHVQDADARDDERDGSDADEDGVDDAGTALDGVDELSQFLHDDPLLTIVVRVADPHCRLVGPCPGRLDIVHFRVATLADRVRHDDSVVGVRVQTLRASGTVDPDTGPVEGDPAPRMQVVLLGEGQSAAPTGPERRENPPPWPRTTPPGSQRRILFP